MGFFKRLVKGLSKTRDNIVSGIDAIFNGFSAIDDDFYEEIEETLVMGDIGINTTNAIIENLKKQVEEKRIKEPMECKELLINSIKEQMKVGEADYLFENQKSVILVIGVNGVGKTTSVGKLAGKLKDQGKKVVLAAADTFRAAAGEQLSQWANRAGVEMIGGQDGADPAAVVYDAIAAAKARNADVLICDTAGRLHNKKNLMEELRKMFKPEFINRIDEIIVFHQLLKDDMKDIMTLLSKDLVGRCDKLLDIRLIITPAVKTAIVDKYMNLKMGARPLKRAIQSEIEDMLAEEILAQRVKSGDTVKVRYQDKKIVFEVVSQ